MTRETAFKACAIVAVAGLTTGASAIDWAAAVDGDWNNAANWAGADIPNTPTDNAALGLSGMYTVSMTDSFSIGSLSINNANAVLTMDIISNTLNGNLANQGEVVVNTNASNLNSRLIFATNSTIAGIGTITLNGAGNSDDAQIVVESPFTVIQAPTHTIHGTGRIVGAMINNGIIIADSKTGPLYLTGTLTQSGGGTAGADGGILALESGSITTGGEFFTQNGGSVDVAGSHPVIGNIINSGDLNIPGNGYFLDLDSSITNNGTIRVNSTEQVFNAHIQFLNAGTIGGSGEVMMKSVGELQDAQMLIAGAFNSTIGPNQTVSGSGLINGAGDGTLINQGTIRANDPSVGLGLGGLHMGDGGIYRADGDGRLLLRTGLSISNAVFETSGNGTIDKDNGGVSTFSGVTNQGRMNILGNAAYIDLAGPLVNNGILSLNDDQQVFNAHLRFAASTSITGTGRVRMKSTGNLDDAQIFTNGPFNGIIGASQTVEGSGRIEGGSGGTIINNGTINGNDAATKESPAIELRLRGNHDGSGGGVYRSDNGILGFDSGLVLNGGTFDSSGVGIVEKTTGGVATLSNVTNLGQMGVRGQGGTIALIGPMVNQGDIFLNTNGQVFNAHLRFDDSTSLTGSGSVTMKSVGNLDDAQFYTNGVVNAIIGVGQLVHGSGQVDGRSGGTIFNNGTINADDPLIELRLRGNHNGSGGGVYRADTGILGLSSGLVMTGGTFDSSGTGSVSMTTNGSATLSNMTNNGIMSLMGLGGIVELAGPLTNNGGISINPDNNIFNGHIRFQADTVIGGAGTIDMNIAGNFDDAQIIAATGFTGTIGAGQTVSGEGSLVGNLNINGTIDPGGNNREFRIDHVQLSPTSALIADLGGLADSEFDRMTLNPGDTIDLDGTLTVQVDPGYFPAFGDSWDIIEGGTITGEFATVLTPSAQLGQDYKVIYLQNRVFVIVTCDVDLNGDNMIDFLDISLFLTYFNENDIRGDFNGDGQFDFLDISIFIQLINGDCV